MANHCWASIFRNRHTYQLTHSDVKYEKHSTIASIKMATGEPPHYTYNLLCIVRLPSSVIDKGSYEHYCICILEVSVLYEITYI